MPNDVVLRTVTDQIRERQLRFFGHVARYPKSDPAHRILDAADPRRPDARGKVWKRPVGAPHGQWRAQVSKFLPGGMGPAQAWSMAQRRPGEWSRKVSAAMRR